jgi:hypothetical protein
MSSLDHLRLHLAAALSAAAPPPDRAAAERWLSAAAAASPAAYCDALLALIAGDERGEQAGTRFLAAVQLKNVVAKRWREAGGSGLPRSGAAAPSAGCPSCFSDRDRARLRPLLLSWLLSEPQRGVAQIAAVAVSKVARHDWPSSWPELLPELASAAAAALATTGAATDSGSGSKRALRARLGLASVLKELASKRLSSDVRAFRALATAGGAENGSSDAGQQQLLPLLWQTFLGETRALLGSLSSDSSSSVSEEAFESWSLVLKSARVLLVSGFSETATEGNGNGDGATAGSSFSGPRAVAAVAAALPPLSEACTALFSQPRGGGMKASLKVIKALRMLSEAHPWSLVASGAVPAAVRVAAAAISSTSDDDKDEKNREADEDDDGGRAMTAGRVVVQSCLLIKAALSAVQDATPPPKQQQGASCDGGGGGSGSGYNSVSSSQRGGGLDRLSSARTSVASALPAARDALSGPSLASLVDALVSRQLRLRKGDLSLWRDDPEAWALSAESSSAAWRDSRRGAAEALLSAAVAAERGTLAPRLAQRLRETCARFDGAAAAVAASTPSLSAVSALIESALDKEAAAAAATVASYELHDHVSFSEWLAVDLARDLEGAAGSGPPPSAAVAAPSPAASRSLSSLPRPVASALARRACLAVAAWVPRATREDRLRCYPPLISALAGGGGDRGGGGGGGRTCDAAVALAAATALRSLVDDWDFVEEDFAPMSGAAFAAAARALGGGGSSTGAASLLSDADAHVQVFGLVGVIVDRLPPGSVAAHAPSLMQFLPAVWAGGGGEGGEGGSPSSSNASSSMLRVQCVSLLSRLLLSLGDESPAAYSALLPMLSECLSEPPSGPRGSAAGSADLVEDGLGLWLVALRTAPTAWGGPRARPLVAAGCAAAAQALERTSATALAPLAAAGAGSAALLSCVFSDGSSGPRSNAAAAAAAVEFAALPEAKRLCDRLALAAGEASERAAMALVSSVDLMMASVTSPQYPEASRAALALLQNSLVGLAASVLRGREGPAVAGGVAALVARVVLAGEESGGAGGGGSGGGGGGAALAALASAAAAAAVASAAAVPEKGSSAAPPPSLPNPPSLALIDLMLERAPSLPSGARKTIALALAAVLSSPQALPTEALLVSVAEANPAVAPWSRSRCSDPRAAPPPSRPLLLAVSELLAAAVEEFEDTGAEGNGTAAAAAAAGTNPNNDNDENEGEQLPLRFLFDSSMAESAAVGAAGGDCSALSESVDAEGEAQRRALLRRKGAVATVRVSGAIAVAASAAAASRGAEAWASALAALDPRVAGALRAAAERGG